MEIQKKKYSDGVWWTLRQRINHAVHDGNTVTIQPSYRRWKLARVDNLKQKKAPDAVLKAAEKILAEHNHEAVPAATVSKLGDFVENVFLLWVEKKKRRSTYRGYRNLWKLYFKDRCSEWWLRETGTPQLVALLEQVLAQHDLNASTMHRLKAFLSGVCTFAIAYGYYKGVHPLNVKQGGIRIAFPDAKPAAGDDDLHAYTNEEIAQILSLVPDPAATAIATAGYTGLRRGELAGLLWENYHPAENGRMASVFVSQSVVLGRAGEPKTPESKAPVPVVKLLAQRLEIYRLRQGNPATGPVFRQPAAKIVNSEAWHPLDFDNVTQRVIVPSLQWCKHEGCGKRRIDHNDKKAGHSFELDESRIVWHGWHGFRRGLATNLYRMGVPDKVIQKILRHKNLKTTTDIYVRPNQADKEAGMKTLESALDMADCTPDAPQKRPPTTSTHQ